MRLLHKLDYEGNCNWVVNARSRPVMTSLESAMGSCLSVQYPFAAGSRKKKKKKKESLNAPDSIDGSSRTRVFCPNIRFLPNHCRNSIVEGMPRLLSHTPTCIERENKHEMAYYRTSLLEQLSYLEIRRCTSPMLSM